MEVSVEGLCCEEEYIGGGAACHHCQEFGMMLFHSAGYVLNFDIGILFHEELQAVHHALGLKGAGFPSHELELDLGTGQGG